jgi:hypothetical protein
MKRRFPLPSFFLLIDREAVYFAVKFLLGIKDSLSIPEAVGGPAV